MVVRPPLHRPGRGSPRFGDRVQRLPRFWRDGLSRSRCHQGAQLAPEAFDYHLFGISCVGCNESDPNSIHASGREKHGGVGPFIATRRSVPRPEQMGGLGPIY
jgi:hypothetical protein